MMNILMSSVLVPYIRAPYIRAASRDLPSRVATCSLRSLRRRTQFCPTGGTGSGTPLTRLIVLVISRT